MGEAEGSSGKGETGATVLGGSEVGHLFLKRGPINSYLSCTPNYVYIWLFGDEASWHI